MVPLGAKSWSDILLTGLRTSGYVLILRPRTQYCKSWTTVLSNSGQHFGVQNDANEPRWHTKNDAQELRQRQQTFSRTCVSYCFYNGRGTPGFPREPHESQEGSQDDHMEPPMAFQKQGLVFDHTY